MIKLCPYLQPILELELQLGNEIARVDQPAGTKCPLGITMCRPMHKAEIESSLQLGPEVESWKCTDLHYPQEEGYFSNSSRHSIAGPIMGTPIAQQDLIDSVNRLYDFAYAAIATARSDRRFDVAEAMDDALHMGTSGLEIIGTIKVTVLDHQEYLRTRFSAVRLRAVVEFVERSFGQR